MEWQKGKDFSFLKIIGQEKIFCKGMEYILEWIRDSTVCAEGGQVVQA